MTTALAADRAIKNLTKENAGSLRDRALAAAKAHTRVSVEYAEVLWATYNGSVMVGNEPIPVWELWDFESWYAYLEKELEIHQSTAHAYVRMYEKFFIDLDGEWDKSLLVSMTKMCALTRVVKNTNVEWWLRRAAKLTCCGLDAAIKQALYGTAKKRFHNFVVKFTNKELTNVNAILEVAWQSFPKAEGRNEVLMSILEEWYSIHKAKGQRQKLKLLAGDKK